MKLTTLSNRVSALFPLDVEDSLKEDLYILEIEPSQLEMALLEPDVILRADGVTIPEGADLLVEFSNFQKTSVKPKKKVKVKVVIKVRGSADVDVDVDVN